MPDFTSPEWEEVTQTTPTAPAPAQKPKQFAGPEWEEITPAVSARQTERDTTPPVSKGDTGGIPDTSPFDYMQNEAPTITPAAETPQFVRDLPNVAKSVLPSIGGGMEKATTSLGLMDADFSQWFGELLNSQPAEVKREPLNLKIYPKEAPVVPPAMQPGVDPTITLEESGKMDNPLLSALRVPGETLRKAKKSAADYFISAGKKQKEESLQELKDIDQGMAQIETDLPVKSFAGKTLRDALVSIGSQVPMYAMAFSGMGLPVSLGAMGFQSGLQDYGDKRVEGLPPLESFVGGTITGLSESLTELIPAEKLVDLVKGKNVKVLQNVLQMYLSDLVGENVNTAINDTTNWLMLPSQKDVTPQQFMQKLAENMVTTTATTAWQNTLMAGAGYTGRKILKTEKQDGSQFTVHGSQEKQKQGEAPTITQPTSIDFVKEAYVKSVKPSSEFKVQSSEAEKEQGVQPVINPATEAAIQKAVQETTTPAMTDKVNSITMAEFVQKIKNGAPDAVEEIHSIQAENTKAQADHIINNAKVIAAGEAYKEGGKPALETARQNISKIEKDSSGFRVQSSQLKDIASPAELQPAFLAQGTAGQKADIYTDHLTGVYNRRAFDIIKNSATPDMKVAHISIEGTKWANDEHTHEAGDALYKTAAATLHRLNPTVAKAGGDFVMLVKDDAELARILKVANQTMPAVPMKNKKGKARNYTGFTFTGATGALNEALDDISNRHGKIKEALEISGDRAPRGKPPKGLSTLTGPAVSADIGRPSIDLLHPELEKHYAGKTPEEHFKNVYYEPETGLLTEKGFKSLKLKKHVASIDLNGLKVLNSIAGMSGGDLILQAYGKMAMRQGAEKFDMAHLHGDEYALHGDDPTAIQTFIETLHFEAEMFTLDITAPGGTIVIKGITFAEGIGGTYEEADQKLTERKAGQADQNYRGTGPALRRIRQVTPEGIKSYWSMVERGEVSLTDLGLDKASSEEVLKELSLIAADTRQLNQKLAQQLVDTYRSTEAETSPVFNDKGEIVASRNMAKVIPMLPSHKNTLSSEEAAILEKFAKGKSLKPEEVNTVQNILDGYREDMHTDETKEPLNIIDLEVGESYYKNGVEYHVVSTDGLETVVQDEEGKTRTFNADHVEYIDRRSKSKKPVKIFRPEKVAAQKEEVPVEEAVPSDQPELLKTAPQAGETLFNMARIKAGIKEVAPAGPKEQTGREFEKGQVEGQENLFEKPAEGELKPQEKIVDFGEKIGGARKDTAEKTGPKTKFLKEEEDDTKQEAWRKKYIALQKVGGTGWVIGKRAEQGGSMFGMARTSQVFATQEEAEKAIPLYAVAESHRVLENKDKTFSIYKLVSDRKRVKVVNQDFASREEGMKYMATHAVEILNIKTTFGEEILPVPEIAVRKGTERRKGPATAEMFMETFAPRGIEFGNWNNQEERQQVMDHAYDGLLDLAEALNLPPKALMLNGELAIAFGARGQGLTGAKAHYERDYGVINLTKMKGAGSLAHEWFHAFDHYLARLDTKASSEKIKNDLGDMVYKASSRRVDYMSHGASYKSQMRAELKEAFDTLIKTMYEKGQQYVEDTERAEKFVGTAREHLRGKLNEIRAGLVEDQTRYRGPKYGLPATAEKLAEFDQLANILIEGGNLELKWKSAGDGKISRRSVNGRMTNDTLESINAIIKSVRNYQGFSSKGHGDLDAVRQYMRIYAERLKMFQDARAGTEKTKKVPTNFRIEATKMDQARTSDYWSEPHEMAARAFASYVEDKVMESGGQSDFIVYRAHGGILHPMIDGFVGRPYPEGDERVAINKAFDEFIKTLKIKETEKGTALFKIEKKTSGKEGVATEQVLADIVTEIERIAAPETTVKFFKEVIIPKEDRARSLKQWGEDPDAPVDIRGAHYVVPIDKGQFTSFIALALDEVNSKTTHYHEAFHSVQEILLSKGEKKVLEAKFPQKNGVSSMERQADAFAEFAAQKAEGKTKYKFQFSQAVITIFEKIQNFLAKLGNFLRGRGFDTAESIFEKAYEGRLRERAEKDSSRFTVSPFEDYKEHSSQQEQKEITETGIPDGGLAPVSLMATPKDQKRPLTGSTSIFTKDVIKNLPGVLRSKNFGLTAQDTDISHLERNVSLPFYISEKYPEFRKVFELELLREEKRGTLLSGMLKVPETTFNGQPYELAPMTPQETTAVVRAAAQKKRFSVPELDQRGFTQNQVVAYSIIKSAGSEGGFLSISSKEAIQLFHVMAQIDGVGDTPTIQDLLDYKLNDKQIAAWYAVKQAGDIHPFLALKNKDAEAVFTAMVESDATNKVMSIDSLKERGMSDEQIIAYFAWKRSMDTAWNLIAQNMDVMALKPYEKAPFFGLLKDVYDGKIGAHEALEKFQGGEIKDDIVLSGTLAGADVVAFNKALDSLQPAHATIQQLRREIGKIQYYVPRYRGEGKYVVRVRDDEGNVIWSERAGNKVTAGTIKARLIEAFPDMKVTDSIEPKISEAHYEMLSDVGLERFIDAALKKTEEAHELDTKEVETVRDALLSTVTDYLKARGFGSQTIARNIGAVIGGYQTESGKEIYLRYMGSLAGYITKQEAAFNFALALREMDVKKHPQLFEEATSYVKDMLRNTTSLDNASAHLRAMAFGYYLAGNLKTAMVQMTQNIITGMPVLSRETSFAEIKYAKAMADVSTGHMTEAEKKVIAEAIDKGITTDQYIKEVTGRAKGWAGSMWEKFTYAASLPFRGMEIFNRKAAFLAMYRVQTKKGLSHDEAFAKARDFVYKTHYLMGKANLPGWARGGTLAHSGARTAYTFRSFTHNYLVSMYELTKHGPEGKWAFGVLSRSLLYLFLIGGASSLPWLDDALDFIEKQTGNPLRAKMREFLKAHGNDIVAQFGMEGLAAAVFGVDISGSIKTGIPFIGGGGNDVIGVYGGMLNKGKKTIGFVSQGDFLRAVESGSPIALENMFRAWREYYQGIETPEGKAIFDEKGKPVELNEWEALKQGMSFRPEKTAELSKEKRSYQNMKTHYADERDTLITKFRKAHDPDDKKAVIEDIKEYNEKAAGTHKAIPRITMQTLRRGIRPTPDKGFMRFNAMIEDEFKDDED